jgi:hypothetical protein
MDPNSTRMPTLARYKSMVPRITWNIVLNASIPLRIYQGYLLGNESTTI